MYPHAMATKQCSGECTYECWIELKGNTVQVKARLNNARSDKSKYKAKHQELPAVYTNGPYYRLMTYTGSKPFTGDKLIKSPKSRSKVFPWTYWLATENWAALVNDDDWGLGFISRTIIIFLVASPVKKVKVELMIHQQVI